MKYTLLPIIWLLATINTFSQSPQYDQKYLSAQLEPFRRHLDKVTSGLDAKSLIKMYQKKMDTGDTIVYSRKNHFVHNYYSKPILTKKDSITLTPPKYSLNDIYTMDNNRAAFIEIDYPLNNRLVLIKYRNEYNLAISTQQQIVALLNYVQALNASYPKYLNWNFASSNTLEKHVEQLQKLFNKIPADTSKADLLQTYADMLESINMRRYTAYIYNLYIEAESILLMQYWDLLEKNRAAANPKEDGKIYEEFLFSQKNGERLVSVYESILPVFSIMLSEGSIGNELQPLIKKKRWYQSLLHEAYEILSKKDKKYEEYKNDLEDNITAAYSTMRIDSNTKYISEIIAEKIFVLKNSLYKLLIDSNRSRLSVKRIHDMYLSLGMQFNTLHDNEYELKCYLKALEIFLQNNIIVNSEEQETYYYLISGALRSKRNAIKYFDREFLNVIEDFYYLYQLTNQSKKLSVNQHEPIYHTLYFINHARFKELVGDWPEAKRIIFEYKKQLFSDSSLILNEFFIKATGFIYTEIYESKFPLQVSGVIGLERSMDSIALTYYPFTNKLQVFLNGSENIIEQFANIERDETTIRWRYYTQRLDKLIKQKQAEFERLLNKAKDLQINIDTLNTKIKATTKRLEEEGEKSEALFARNRELEKNRDSINIEITDATAMNNELQSKNSSLVEDIKGSKKRLRSTNITLGITLGIICLLFFVSRWQVRRNRTLRQETADLLSVKEANEKAYFLDLQYKNEHIKNELSVKHEIAGVFDNLVASFSLIEKNVRTSSVTEFERKLEKSHSFAKTYYKSLDSDTYRTIEDEIFLSQQYIEFVKMRKNTEQVHFWDKRTIKKQNIPIPPHLINNFVKNSEEKARIPDNPLNIEISDSSKDGNYVLQIKDDGKGVNPDFNIDNLPAESTGLRNVLSQIEYYNARPDQEYQIQFDSSSVLNREFVEGIKGTVIKLMFTPKP